MRLIYESFPEMGPLLKNRLLFDSKFFPLSPLRVDYEQILFFNPIALRKAIGLNAIGLK